MEKLQVVFVRKEKAQLGYDPESRWGVLYIKRRTDAAYNEVEWTLSEDAMNRLKKERRINVDGNHYMLDRIESVFYSNSEADVEEVYLCQVFKAKDGSNEYYVTEGNLDEISREIKGYIKNMQEKYDKRDADAKELLNVCSEAYTDVKDKEIEISELKTKIKKLEQHAWQMEDSAKMVRNLTIWISAVIFFGIAAQLLLKG